jgi:hypothetical protein
MAEQEARDAGERAGQRERQDDVARDRNADGARHVPVRRDRAHAPADLRALEQEPERGDQHAADNHDRQRLEAERHASQRDRTTADERRRGARRGSHRHRQSLLDHRGERQGRDEGRFGRPSHQRQDRDVSGQHAGKRERQRHQRQQQETRHVEPRREQDRDRAAQHDEVAVREVDGTGRVQRQHEAQRDQRIGHAQRQRVEDELGGDQNGLSFPSELENHLTLRSGPQGRVSKGGNPHRSCCPSFETLAALAPQDEVSGLQRRVQRNDPSAPWARACPGCAATSGDAC